MGDELPMQKTEKLIDAPFLIYPALVVVFATSITVIFVLTLFDASRPISWTLALAFVIHAVVQVLLGIGYRRYVKSLDRNRGRSDEVSESRS